VSEVPFNRPKGCSAAIRKIAKRIRPDAALEKYEFEIHRDVHYEFLPIATNLQKRLV
jgi:hypothetical protein